MSSIPTPSELVRLYGRPAKKSLGQNFLTDPSILDRIVALIRVGAGERVLEVGPGPGGLTSRLMAAGAHVVAIEADRDAAAFLEETLAPLGSLEVHNRDALDGALEELIGSPRSRVVANLPYNVATEILMRLVHLDDPPARMALMFQKEVAERIACAFPSRKAGPLGAAVQLRYRPRIAMKLPPGAFRPAPKVHSAVVLFERRETPIAEGELEQMIQRLVRGTFGQRRKMLRKSLGGVVEDSAAVLAAANVEPTARPEELSLDEWLALGRAALVKAG